MTYRIEYYDTDDRLRHARVLDAQAVRDILGLAFRRCRIVGVEHENPSREPLGFDVSDRRRPAGSPPPLLVPDVWACCEECGCFELHALNTADEWVTAVECKHCDAAYAIPSHLVDRSLVCADCGAISDAGHKMRARPETDLPARYEYVCVGCAGEHADTHTEDA